MADNLTVRRAKQADLEAIAAFVQKASESTRPEGAASLVAEPAAVNEWLFQKGVWVALQDSTLAGVAAWQAENLVSVTDVLHIAAGPSWAEVAGRLLEIIEGEAKILMCEINAVLLPNGTSPAVHDLLHKQGYEDAELEELHRFWQEVLSEFLQPNSAIMVKHLRDRMVMTPR
jgi:hypothetical protein